MKRIERHLQHVTSCVSFHIESDDDDADDGGITNEDESDENCNVADKLKTRTLRSDDGPTKFINVGDNTSISSNSDIKGSPTTCDNNGKYKHANVRRHLPPGSGKHSVGCVDIMDDQTDDGLFFRLFYPVEKTDVFERHTQWPLWLPRKQYGHGYAKFLKKKPTKFLGKLFNWLGGDVYIPALWQAPVLEGSERVPVVVMSHGIGGNRTSYSAYCCELASHGFIVAAVEHRDGSASMTYQLKDNIRASVAEVPRDRTGGRSTRSSMVRSHSFKEEWKSFEHVDGLGIRWNDYEYRNRQVHQRGRECSKLLDLLTDINNGISVRNCLGFNFNLKQFKGRLDLAKAAVVGHSFGGSTVVTTLADDSRFKMGIMLDPWMHPLNKELCQRVEQPILVIAYEKFQWRENVEQFDWLKMAGKDRRIITIRGACHQAVSDFQFIVNKYLGRLMMVRSDLSPKIAMELNRRASLSFLGKHLDLNDFDQNDDVIKARHELIIEGGAYARLVCPEPEV